MREIVEYITSFDATFPSRIEGASASEIDRLEQVSGSPLPPEYREFLEVMGRQDDDIFGSDDIVSSAARLAEYYEESVHTGEDDVPPDCVVIAVSGLSIEQLVLERSAPGRVYQSIVGTKENLWAASLRGLLHQEAFRRLVQQSGSMKFLYSHNTSPRQNRAEHLFDTLGLERRWFSDEVTLCYESAQDKILLRQIGGQSAFLYISSQRPLFRRWGLVKRLRSELDF